MRLLRSTSLCLALLGALAGSSAFAQSGAVLAGRVVKDGAPVPAADVVLHQVTDKELALPDTMGFEPGRIEVVDDGLVIWFQPK